MLRLIICDDDTSTNEKLKKQLQSVIEEQHIYAHIELVTKNPYEVLEYVKENRATYVIFLDIYFGDGETGIEIAEKIRMLDLSSFIIYVTAHPDYALKGYGTDAFHFLTKPVEYAQLSQTLQRIVLKIQTYKQNESVIWIKVGSKNYRIAFEEIIYITKQGRKLDIITNNKQLGTIQAQLTIKEFQDKVEQANVTFFIQCERSCIVNKNYIVSFDYINRLLIMKNGDRCCVSRRYSKTIKEMIKILL